MPISAKEIPFEYLELLFAKFKQVVPDLALLIPKCAQKFFAVLPVKVRNPAALRHRLAHIAAIDVG